MLRAVRPRVHLCGHLHLAQRRDLAEPPVAVLNTGGLPQGDYVLLTAGAAALQVEARRL